MDGKELTDTGLWEKHVQLHSVGTVALSEPTLNTHDGEENTERSQGLTAHGWLLKAVLLFPKPRGLRRDCVSPAFCHRSERSVVRGRQ